MFGKFSPAVSVVLVAFGPASLGSGVEGGLEDSFSLRLKYRAGDTYIQNISSKSYLKINGQWEKSTTNSYRFITEILEEKPQGFRVRNSLIPQEKESQPVTHRSWSEYVIDDRGRTESVVNSNAANSLGVYEGKPAYFPSHKLRLGDSWGQNSSQFSATKFYRCQVVELTEFEGEPAVEIAQYSDPLHKEVKYTGSQLVRLSDGFIVEARSVIEMDEIRIVSETRMSR